MINKALILINAPFPFKAGGTEEKLYNQVKSLHSKGIEVKICASNLKEKEIYYDVSTCAKIDNLGWNYRTFDNNLLFKIIYFIMFHIKFVFSAYRNNVDTDADVIEVKDPYSGIAGVWLKKLTQAPLVLETAGAFGFKMSKLYDIKFGKFKSKAIYFFINIIEKYVYRNCDAIITEDDCEKYMRSKGFKGKYYRIPNGVDTERFKPNKIPHKPTMLYVGRINPEKNVEYIIKNKPEGKLLIVGDGMYYGELKGKYTSDDIIFEGFKSNTWDYYNQADVLIMASAYESLPCVILEAMACGIPVVSTDVGMINEVIDNGANGFLYDLENVDRFKQKVKWAIEFKKKLGTHAREKILNNYDWSKLIDKYLEVYNGMC